MKIARLVYENQVPSIDVEKEVLGNQGVLDIVTVTVGASEQDIVDATKGYEALLSDYVPLTKKVLQSLPELQVISLASTGFTSVDVKEAKKLGIRVAAIGEYCTQEVAEHTMAVMLSLARNLQTFYRSVQIDREWDWLAAPNMMRLEGQTLGIVGFGKIGQAVSKRAKSFGMCVVAHDPYLPPEVAKEQKVPLKEIDHLLQESDFITVHMAVEDGQKPFFDYEKFKSMKKKPYFINLSRGSAVNEDDLVIALDNGLLKGAALDVLKSEAPDLESNELIGRENVIITPHVAFYSRESMYLNNKISMENLIYALKDELNKVNRLIV